MNIIKRISFSKQYTPRWVIFLIDISICIFSFAGATILRHNFDLTSSEVHGILTALPVALAVRIFYFSIMKTYAGIVRYTGTQDAIRIFSSVTFSSFTIWVISVVYGYALDKAFLIPLSVIIIDYIATMFLMTSFRITTKILYYQLRTPSSERVLVGIYGAGQSGIITKRTLDSDGNSNYRVVAFFDDDETKIGKIIEGVKIYSAKKDFEDILRRNKIEELIISIQNISPLKKKVIIETCLSQNVEVLNVPPVEKWINGELSFNQIRNVKIEDLIEREPIELDKIAIAKQLKKKRVLITGAAGSIGSELVRQIATFYPEKLILLDKSETPLYNIENEILENPSRYNITHNIEVVLGDVSNYARMRKVFEEYRPQIVFHAAAYKHVPLMENNPSEAVKSNILGTKNIADLAVEFNAEKFVFVSTDKAVNPTNIMGASKRIAEIYVQSLNDKLSYAAENTRFITTRFGNVLGSNGSVIPRFRKQIEEGGPVTVTHPEITRYFMTISEACQLVLEAGTMGKGGEIFIFDMGESVKILDLAKKMIKLSGLVLGKDIQIAISGLRPGEKIKEELLNDLENTIPTYHSKIMIAQVRTYDFEEVNNDIINLINLYDSQSQEMMVKKMKEIVPEFVSQNSIYETLDKSEQAHN